jgi:dihydropteroate synthase
MKVKLAFWTAVVLAFIGAHAPEGALFYFFATHLLAVSAGLFLLRREHAPRAGVKAQAAGRKSSPPPSKTKTG